MSEILFPLLITLTFGTIYFYVLKDEVGLVQRISNTNASISTVMAIQIGFNMTCLALIASFGRETSLKTFKNATSAERKDSMNQIISSFVYAIIIQTAILALGITHLMVIEPLSFSKGMLGINEILLTGFKISYFVVWVFLIFHSFAVFIRNVYLIQLYLLVNVKNE